VRNDYLCLSVCGSIWINVHCQRLALARPHPRDDDSEKPTWDEMRSLGKKIPVLQAELDRLLGPLEDESATF
jgi:hypothetical protein